MPASTLRDQLLKDHIRPLRRSLAGVRRGDPAAIHAARISTRRLRELTPLLGFDATTAKRLTRRLRKLGRQLGRVRALHSQLQLVDELLLLDRAPGQLLRQMREGLVVESPASNKHLAGRRFDRRIEKVVQLLRSAESPEHRTGGGDGSRALGWAAHARVVRRARLLREALDQTGALYEPERLHDVRLAVKKLRYAAALSAVANGQPGPSELRFLKRLQGVLGQLRDAQVLLDRLRAEETGTRESAVGAWREYERLTALLDKRCRRQHGRFLALRAQLLALCKRLGPASADGIRRRRQAS